VLYSLELRDWHILDDLAVSAVLTLALALFATTVIFTALIAATIKALNTAFHGAGSFVAVSIPASIVLWSLISFSFSFLPEASAWDGVPVVLLISTPMLVALFTAVESSRISPALLHLFTAAERSRFPVRQNRKEGVVETAWFKLLAVFVVLGLGLWFIISIYLKPAPIALFDFVRASDLWNGVSPLHPLLFAGIAGLCMAVSDLRRLNLLQECRVNPPFLGFDRDASSFDQDVSSSFVAVGKCEEEVADRLKRPFHRLPLAWPIAGLVIFAGFYFIVIRQWPMLSVDGPAFAWFFDSLFIAVSLLFFMSLLRFACIWWSLRKFLRILYWHPSRTAYEELRKETVPDRSEAQHITLFEPRPSLTAIESSIEFARKLVQHGNKVGAAKGSLSVSLANKHASLCDRVCEAEHELISALQGEADNSPIRAIHARREAQAAMARLSAVVVRIVEPLWRAILRPSMPVPDQEEKQILELGNLFVAARVVDFLRQVFPQMLNLAGCSMVGALAMTLAVSGYPFPGRDTMLWFSWLVLLSVIGTILVVFIQMNRDRVLSMLTGTTPGKLNWNSSFVLQLLVFGIIPVLTLLGAQFPYALSGMLSWIGGLFGGSK
jgi:hypothetical protein